MGLAVIVAIVVAAGLVLVPGVPAAASISGVSPAQGGTLEPGDSTQFSLTTDASCIRAVGDSPNYIVILDPGGLCGLAGDRTATVSVVTTPLTPPGTYTITVIEVGLNASDSYGWTFAVDEDTATTSTTATQATTTTAAPTTTAPPASSTTTTTAAQVTTTTVGPDLVPGDTETPGSKDEPTTTPTSAEVADAEPDTTSTTTATGTTTPQADDEAGNQAGDVDEGSSGPDVSELAASEAAAQPPGLSGPGREGFLSLFDEGTAASLEGMQPGYFAALFEDDSERRGTQASPRLPWVLVLMAFTPVLLTAFVYLRRPEGR